MYKAKCSMRLITCILDYLYVYVCKAKALISDFIALGIKQNHKFENAMTLDKYSWGFRRDAQLNDYLTTQELISTLVQTVRYTVSEQ